MEKTRLAVIGLGNMGAPHCRDIANLDCAELTAVCDIDGEKSKETAALYGCRSFTSAEELLDSGLAEGVILAMPHYGHTTAALQAFARGIHVLTEKPVGVHVKDIRKMITAWEEGKKKKSDLVFSAMFQQRTRGAARKIKDLIDSGELGRLIRTTWIITDWYRTQAYYNSGGWRATWAGEGGGVLINQCPHQLDMYQWFTGCPSRVTGFASFGKYHDIEVEDEVTAYFEHENGMVGQFITSTGEAPGTNRLEIVGENGKLVWEDDKLSFQRNRVSLLDHLKNSDQGFEKPENWSCTVPFLSEGGEHRIIIENFCDAITGRAGLIADASEGLNSIAIDNAIRLSSLEGRTVEIPFDEDAYETRLKELIAGSAR